MKIKMFFFIVSNIFYLQASLIDRSLRFLENPAEKAVVNQSISNIQVHLEGQMTSKYWDYLKGEKEVNLSCLMNERNNNEAARVLGLLPQNVRSIEKMIKTFKMQDPNIGDIRVETFAFSRMPNFIASEYENRTSEYIEAYLKMKYGQSGSQENEHDEDDILRYPEIRSSLALLAFKKAYKEKRGHEKHWFVKKVANVPTNVNDTADRNKKEDKALVRLSLSDQKEIQGALYDAPNFFKHIQDISYDYIQGMLDNQAKNTDSLDIDSSLDNQLKYIIFPVECTLNREYLRKLDIILLDASKKNNSLTVVAVWNDTAVKIESDDICSRGIENLICVGNNIQVVSDHCLVYFSKLENLDLSFGESLEEIGKGFLRYSYKLKYLDLSKFKKVKKIGNNFFAQDFGLISELKKLDLGFGESLEEIGDSFLYRCSNLKYLDLSKCHNVEKIGDDFLYDCSALREIIVSKKIYDLLIERDPKFFEQFKNLQPDKIKVVDSDGILTFPQVK